MEKETGVPSWATQPANPDLVLEHAQKRGKTTAVRNTNRLGRRLLAFPNEHLGGNLYRREIWYEATVMKPASVSVFATYQHYVNGEARNDIQGQGQGKLDQATFDAMWDLAQKRE